MLALVIPPSDCVPIKRTVQHRIILHPLSPFQKVVSFAGARDLAEDRGPIKDNKTRRGIIGFASKRFRTDKIKPATRTKHL